MSLDGGTADQWLNGGLRTNGLHEFHAERPEDSASTTGFALLLAQRKCALEHRPVLWVREGRKYTKMDFPYGPGLLHLGLRPESLIIVILPDAKAVLRAALDSVRHGAAAVLIELSGKQPLLDLTATRRFALAAQERETMVLFSRSGTEPAPSAAHTRWRIASAPSRPLDAQAPGHPAFDLTLLRHRGGRDGLQLILEWDRDTASFRQRTGQATTAPVSRPAPALAFGGTGSTERHHAA